MAIPRQTSVWDERRNTSRVHAVPPDALPAAIAALEALRRNEPALVEWIADGAPNLTHAQHAARFGEPYQRKRSRRK